MSSMRIKYFPRRFLNIRYLVHVIVKYLKFPRQVSLICRSLLVGRRLGWGAVKRKFYNWLTFPFSIGYSYLHTSLLLFGIVNNCPNPKTEKPTGDLILFNERHLRARIAGLDISQ